MLQTRELAVRPMTALAGALRRVASDLASARAPWALVGGLAVSVRGEPRFTRDIDIAVAVATDTDAERLVADLLSCGYRTLAVLEHEATGRLATVRLRMPGQPASGIIVDLLLASSGIEAEIAAAAESMVVFPGVAIPVARRDHLMALKVLARDDARRPMDRADLLTLLAVASASEIESAIVAMNLVTERGYARGKNLVAEFSEVRADSAVGDGG